MSPATGAGEPAAEQVLDIRLRVNGVQRSAPAPARRLLSDFLRHDLGLTGTHVGCEHGVCGACTVLVDGQPMRSCLMFAVTAQAHEITTVEGIGSDPDAMSPVQQAFAECHGLQCGFCTPGFITTITAYLDENPDPTPEQAREAISGNLCRCTGYQNIVRAVGRAAEIRREVGAERPPSDQLVESGTVPEIRRRTGSDQLVDSGTVPEARGRTGSDQLVESGTDPEIRGRSGSDQLVESGTDRLAGEGGVPR